MKGKRRKTSKRKAIVLLVLCMALILILVSGAWYVINSSREVESIETDVMTPYFLYLLNPDDEQSLSLTVGNIHPGEVKQAVICVSNKNPDGTGGLDIGKDSNFAYELEMAYTENLPVNYQVYQLKPDDSGTIFVTDEWGNAIKKFSKLYEEALVSKDVSESRQLEMYGVSRNGIVNLGKYDMYSKGGDNQALQLSTTITGGSAKYEMDYYLIEISWKDGINFSDYTKETDLVYVIVKALQPKPVAK